MPKKEIYMKDKDHKITVRLTNDQYQFVKDASDAMEVSPSRFLRMVVNVAMVGDDKAGEAVDSLTDEQLGLIEKQVKEEADE